MGYYYSTSQLVPSFNKRLNVLSGQIPDAILINYKLGFINLKTDSTVLIKNEETVIVEKGYFEITRPIVCGIVLYNDGTVLLMFLYSADKNSLYYKTTVDIFKNGRIIGVDDFIMYDTVTISLDSTDNSGTDIFYIDRSTLMDFINCIDDKAKLIELIL